LPFGEPHRPVIRWDIPAYSVHYFIYIYRLSKGRLIALIAVVVVVVIVLGSVLWYVGTYNGLVQEEEKIDSNWAEVTNQYQRKFDLIPNLVNITNSYLHWEASTLSNITALRTQWTNALATDDVEGMVNASDKLDAQANTIIVTVENYPALNGVVVVDNLMYEISGTENQITVARMRYNDAVQAFNAHLKSFPASIVAGQGGFEARKYYRSSNAPPAP
jgi:LemA protein